MKLKSILSLILFVGISAASVAQQTEVIRLSAPVAVTDEYEVYGEQAENWEPAVSLSSIIENQDEYSGKQVVLETDVAQVCQKKGCFFIAQEGELTARVTFKDYSFFVPTDTQGKNVKLVGVFNVKELSEEQAKHYAEDAGNDPEAINGSQKEYALVATSVLVPLSK